MRVYELAKEYDIKATEFVDVVQKTGIDIKSHLSSLSDSDVAVIRQSLTEETVVENIAPSEPDEEVVVDEVVETYISKEEQTIEPADKIPPEVKEWLSDDSEQLEGVVEDVAESLTQEVVVEPPRGFFGWLRSLFS